jgi:hypothetical protein
MKNTKVDTDSRRDFLKKGAALGAGAAVASVLPETAAAVAEDDPKSERGRKQGYRLTQHVIDYYRTTTI